MNRYIAPSLLAADLTNLRKDIEMINNSEADWIHVDVMDGVFVPNISFGMPLVHAIKTYARKPLDVHLMIVEPEKYIERFRDAGADHLTVHAEATRHLHRTLLEIHEHGMKAGVSLNPATPVHVLNEIITLVDIVLIMSVDPGFGGQKFIDFTYEKVRKTRELIEKSGSHALIEVDGGVVHDNAGALFNAGVDVLVTGTAIFRAENPAGMIRLLKQA
ncbi:MAG TPA: ribulose-phosphate 3-epimerase [Bacteroidales bacterium]|jgi:ribulose-phosphate 3-epimerase|nr:ribulose-phosphate 3-epimerase [Bacteroidales bacterium]